MSGAASAVAPTATASENADALTPAVAQTQADIANAIAAQGNAFAGTVDEAEAKTDALVNGIAKTEAETEAEAVA